MPQFDNPNPFAQAGSTTPPAERKTSGLAVTSFIMSIIFCCPLTTIPAFFMGLIAVTKTGPQTALKGRGFAIAAILISVVGTGMQGFLGSQAWWGWTRMNEAPREVFTAMFNNDAAGVRNSMDQSGGVILKDEEIAAFRSTLEDRYGAYVSCRLDLESGRQTTPNDESGSLSFPYAITFQNGAVDASIEIVFADQSTGEKMGKVGTITIHDPDQGDLIFPLLPQSASPPKADESSPDVSDGG